MLLKYNEYKKYLIDNVDLINNVLKVSLNSFAEIFVKNEIIFIKKELSDKNIYEYDEEDNSIYLIDFLLKKELDVILLTDIRKNYLLETIKRIGEIEKAEKIIIDSVKKGYLD